MATSTRNLYGRITVTNRAIRRVAEYACNECYGVAGASIREVHIDKEENKIYLSIKLILKFGVHPEAVCNSVRSTVKYNVENFTGARVGGININVKEIK